MREFVEEVLRGPVATAVVEVAIENHGAPRPEIGPVTAGSWGPFRLDTVHTSFQIESGGALVLRMEGFDVPPGTDFSVSSIARAPLDVEVAEGRIVAPTGILTKMACDSERGDGGIFVTFHQWVSGLA